MTAEQLIQYSIWAVFLFIFGVVAIQAIRQPSRVHINIALFFSAPIIIILFGIAASFELIQPGPLTNAINTSLILVMVYVLIRLVDDFADVPLWLSRGAALLLLVLIAGTCAFMPPRPPWLTLLSLLYLISLFIYAGIAFVRASLGANGVTRRRLGAVAIGCGCLGALFILSGLSLAAPNFMTTWRVLIDVFALGATLGYYFGFAPPQFLRHVWQEPELRAFLSRTVRLTQLLDIAAIVHELEQATAAAVGTPHATIGLWDENQRSMHFLVNGQLVQRAATDDSPAIQVFETQRSLFVPDVLQAYPARAASSRAYGAKSLLAAPITADNHRLGVLLVYAPYAPIFANDDLTLLQILAGQAAVLLESRALMDEAARVRAHDEATRLKDDFLSAAAHDLKTPITTLLVKAQLLERRAMRNPEAPTDVAGLRVLVQEAQRLRRLVLELLDAARAEQGRLVGDRAEVDLVPIVQMVGARHETRQHHIRIDAPTALVGIYDDVRIEQLFENLLENAVKYSPGGGSIDIKLWSEQEQARLTVSDQGIGVPPQDLASIFDRFYRAGNANERQYVGMGLGLFICRGIVEQHGGQIVVTSTPGIGTTFSVTLPLTPVEAGIADS